METREREMDKEIPDPALTQHPAIHTPPRPTPANPNPQLYVLNTPVLTDWGEYSFRKLGEEEAVALLREEPFVSAVGHEATAHFLSWLTGISIPVNRVAIKMSEGDKAIVFRILMRLPEGKVLTEEELEMVSFEFGLLRKTKD
jgi:hypothetical protein